MTVTKDAFLPLKCHNCHKISSVCGSHFELVLAVSQHEWQKKTFTFCGTARAPNPSYSKPIASVHSQLSFLNA